MILTCCNCVAATAAGGVLVVTKPHACAATWDGKTLQLASTCALSLSGCLSGATAAARRVVVVRRQFDAAARTVASSSAWVCTLCERLSVRAAETNTVQETVQRLSEEAVNSLLYANIENRQNWAVAQLRIPKRTGNDLTQAGKVNPRPVIVDFLVRPESGRWLARTQRSVVSYFLFTSVFQFY